MSDFQSKSVDEVANIISDHFEREVNKIVSADTGTTKEGLVDLCNAVGRFFGDRDIEAAIRNDREGVASFVKLVEALDSEVDAGARGYKLDQEELMERVGQRIESFLMAGAECS